MVPHAGRPAGAASGVMRYVAIERGLFVKRSTDRILTTHVGALPRPPRLQAAFYDRADDPDGFAGLLPDAVAGVVAKQREVGIDVVNDGEYGKSMWTWYAIERLTGFEFRPAETPRRLGGIDRDRFPGFYADAAGRGLWDGDEDRTVEQVHARTPVATSPIGYDLGPVRHDIANLANALRGVDVTEAFLPVAAPASIEVGQRNEYYGSQEEFVWALAEAMRHEYEAIVEAGFLLQVDDAWIPALWAQMLPDVDLDAYTAYCMIRVEALNHALANIAPEKVRYHICWGSWHGPHSADIPMRDLLPIVLRVNAGAYLFEAGNVRHEHEYHVWEDVRLPEGKIIIPGVVSHSTNILEHPELVAERIVRFAERVGRENVLAGTDCGLGGRVHPELVWAKLKSLSEGAELASRHLWTT